MPIKLIAHALCAVGLMLSLPHKHVRAAPSQPLSPAAAAAALSAAESIRNPQEDYSVTCVLSDDDKGKIEVREYLTMIKGRDKALVHYKKPVVDAGKQVLMLDNDMWFHTPTSTKPLRISPKQRLAGNASYGDIARLNFVGNYQPVFIRFDRFEQKEAVVLALTAIDGRPVTYSHIEYWLERQTNRPLKAAYQTMSGKTLKTGYFEQFEKVMGQERPAILRIVDEVNHQHVTTLLFKDMKKSDLPAILFEKQNLGRSG